MYTQNDLRSISYVDYDLFELKWYLTTWCNYRCPYCCQGTEDNICSWRKDLWVPEDKILEEAERINNLFKRMGIKKKLSIQALGGEVSYYNWPKILSKIDNIAKLFITTNFSNKLDYYKDLYTYCYTNGIKLQLLCSYHEVGDEFFEKYLDLTKWCMENDYKIPGLTYVVDNNFDFSFLERFPELENVDMDFCSMLLKDGTIVKLNDDIKQKIDEFNSKPHPWSKNGGSIKVRQGKWLFNLKGEYVCMSQSNLFRNLEQGLLDVKEVYCDAGINSLAILPNGQIIRCVNNYRDLLGNIFDDDINVKLLSSKCKNIKCMLCQPVNICRTKYSKHDPFINWWDNE